jgi:predicted metalloprotease
MRIDDQRESTNFEDRRGQPGGGGGGGGLGLISLIGSRFGIAGIIIAGLLFMLAPAPIKQMVLGMFGGGGEVAQQQAPAETGPPTDVDGKFLVRILGATEDVWTQAFAHGDFAHYGYNGREYRPTTLVAFSGGVGTQCGNATAAVGPFYCPADEKVYIDTTFFQEMKTRFQAPGDFAQAYVIAHEVGHHIQKIIGIADQVASVRQRSDERTINATQVKMELQADCFAGVWASRYGATSNTEGLSRMEAGDLEEGLNAANAIGDDTLQRQARGYVQPDSFTHGTSEQRKRWLRKGYDTGDPAQCDTFGAASL